MCGIVGIHNLESARGLRPETLGRMMEAIRHRGPDEAGIYLDDRVGLGHVRLSIIDIESGGQPIHNEDETLWIVYNGEVFNYVELRAELEERGHCFYTNSDTEVLLHLYEQEGPKCLERLNGQFAFAIWDSLKQTLFLARDRVGIRPLYYTVQKGQLCFASEVKALFSLPGLPRRIDAQGMSQVFTFWTTLPGNTIFEDIRELPPGHYLIASKGGVRTQCYWDIPVFGRQDQFDSPLDTMVENVQELLLDAVRIRLRADVPVGSYLSGGLDSSGIAAITARRFKPDLRTFGIRFDQDGFDEGEHQEQMVSFLGTDHTEVHASPRRIGEMFPEMLWHAEKPLLRTAPVPLLILSRAVRQSGLKVVLTGEGADEVFGGYNVFKEAKVRRFWARQPESQARAALLGQLYDYVFQDRRARHFLKSFFADDLHQYDDPLFSHRVRWRNTSRTNTFFSDDLNAAIDSDNAYDQIARDLPEGYNRLDVVAKAQYLEMKIFLSNYLLSSQGDRVAMANSVEIRLPFLDYRIIDFMARVPSKWKILGLNEKYILKRSLAPVLPRAICNRRKQPYRAPIVCGLLSDGAYDFAMDMLNHRTIASAGLFNVDRVDRLLAKVQAVPNPSEMDSMALAGILSSQIIHDQFVMKSPVNSVPKVRLDVIVDKRTGGGQGTRKTRHRGRRSAATEVVSKR